MYLKHAIEHLPKVAMEITKNKHRKPRSMFSNRITVGGEDEAYDYWQRNKNYWLNTIGAIDWVKTILVEAKNTRSKGIP